MSSAPPLICNGCLAPIELGLSFTWFMSKPYHNHCAVTQPLITRAEAEPQTVRVKPLVWEDGYSSNPHKLTKARCNVIDQEHIIWVDCTDVEAEKRAFEQHRERLILSAIELTPTPVAANPAPDPVSKTQALDALAMQTVTVKSMRDWQDSLNAHGYPDTAVTAGIAADVIQRLPKPDRADVMAEAMKLPEVVALVEALTRARNRLQRLTVEFDTGTINFITVGEWADEAAAALKGAKPPTEYERKVAEMKKDFPNGI